jgi:predicted lipase
MAKFTRRQLLLAGLGGGILLSGLDEIRRLRTLQAQQATLTDIALGSPTYIEVALESAFSGDKKATEEINQIQANLSLVAPNQPYEREISKLLILCCRLGTEQYLTGKFQPKYDGAIQGLPTYSERLQPYRQIAAIRGPEEAEVEDALELPQASVVPFQDPLQQRVNNLKDLIARFSGQTITLKWLSPVYWGFLLTSDSHSILVFRGTQRGTEWVETIRAGQVPAREVAPLSYTGEVHKGFATIYSQLSQPTIAAVKQLDPAIPLYVAGHSLGAPLATLAAQDIASKVPALKDQVRLYTYAGPRVGNPTFAEAHSQWVPNSYRVFNFADPTPLLPPIVVGDLVYVHLGEDWAFTTSNGDIGTHHYVSTYRQAIDQELETLQA